MSFKSIRFGDAVQMISGKTPSKAELTFWDGDIPWISASSMDKLYVSSSTEQITKKALAESGIKFIEKGTPLLLVRGSILHQRIPISVPTRHVTINQDVKALRLKTKEIQPDFFLAWLIASERQLLEKVEFTGIGAGKLDTEVLNKLLIPCPPDEKQQFIGELSKSLNDKIELNSQMNNSLESMAKAIFKEWFIDFGPVKAKAEGKKPFGMDDETTALFPDSFEKSELGLIPKGWKYEKLENLLAALETGNRPKGGVSGYTHGIPNIGAESIVRIGFFDFSKTKYVPEEFHNSLNRGKVKDRDVLLYKDGGKPGLFEPKVSMFGDGFPFSEFSINEHVYRIRLKLELVLLFSRQDSFSH